MREYLIKYYRADTDVLQFKVIEAYSKDNALVQFMNQRIPYLKIVGVHIIKQTEEEKK